MKKSLLALICALPSLCLYAQPTYFSELVGRPYPYVESIYNAIELPDSGFICSLTSLDFLQDTNKIYLTRVDKMGQHIWTKGYGKDSTAHELYEIISTKDSSYLISGLEWQSDGSMASILFKITSNGDSIWLRTFSDGAKYCAFGNMLQTIDHGFLATGLSERVDPITQQSLRRQLYAVKTDSLGQQEWFLNYGAPNFDEVCSDAIQTPDGGYLLVGRKVNPYFFDFSVEGLILKLNAQGAVQWTKTVPSDSFNQSFTTIIPISDGNYILTGGFAHKEELFPDEPFGEGSTLVKINSQGNILWFKRYREATGEAQFQDIVQQPDGGFVAAGYCHYPKESPSLVKFDSDGNVIWWRNYEYNAGKNEAIFDLIPTRDNGFLLTGYAHAIGVVGNSASDGWLLKVDSMGCEIPLCISATNGTETPPAGNLLVFPNPASQSVTVSWNVLTPESTLEIWSVGGVLMQQVQISTQESSKIMDISTLPKGVYFIRLHTGLKSMATKLVVGE